MDSNRNEAEILKINKLQRQYFNKKVDLFEPPLPEGVPDRLEKIVRAGNIKPGERVLDVGTGTGVLVGYILRYNPGCVHICDIAENMLKRVRKKFPGVICHHCDARDLDLPTGSLNVVYINGCFSNIVDKRGCLDNLGRLLDQQGRLVISHPLGSSFIKNLKNWAPFPLDLLPGERDARRLLRNHGFEVETFKDEPEFYLLVGKRRD